MAHTSRRIGMLLAGLAALAMFLVLTVAPRSTAAPAHHGGPKPTIVLVHGAWADSSSWAGVVRRLQDRGYTVDVPPNPLRSLQGDADSLRAYLATVSGPVVLVGHSYGGAVITNAATGNAGVKALVYINAFAPDEGESVVQLATARPGSAIGGDPAQVFDVVPLAGGDVDLYIKRAVFPHAFANDLPPRTAAVLAATQRPVTGSAVGAPSGPPAWRTISSWYLVGTADNVIPPAEQRFMARRAGARTVEVRASHLSMISRPREVTKLIVDAAHSVR
jgi:pimeloyl-ACP methyl ester carboxylesterase